jgi:hypothetical protein
MAVKSLHQIFYYHSKYLNSMKCREISMVHLFEQFSVACLTILLSFIQILSIVIQVYHTFQNF